MCIVFILVGDKVFCVGGDIVFMYYVMCEF